MGYEIKRFVENIDDAFICSICKLIMDTPVKWTCEHSFCNRCSRDCMRKARKDKTITTCPECNKPLEHFELQNDSFSRLLNELITCDLRKANLLLDLM